MSGRAAVEGAWRQIEDVGLPGAGEFRTYETDCERDARPILLALDEHAHRFVLIPVDADASLTEDRRSAGIHVYRRDLERGGEVSDFFAVECRKPHLNGLFTVVAAEMIEAVMDSGVGPDVECRRVLERWRDLIQRESGLLLSNEALTGLYGELLILERLTGLSSAAVQYWTGPAGDRFDFRRGGKALEVKSTLRHEGRFFEIHGQEQLEPVDGGQLHLAAIKLEREVEAGRSVPDLVNAIINAGCDGPELFERLGNVGYDHEEKEYEELRFQLRELRLYKVDDSFPRIVAASFATGAVPAGVMSLRYTIDLTGEPPFAIPDPMAEALLSFLAGS